MSSYFAPYRLAVRLLLVSIAAALIAPAAIAQVPVDENGNPIQAMDQGTADTADTDPSVANDNATSTLLGADDLQALVGPIALYPDDLLAIVLPASTYPVQIVEAARFLDAHEKDSTLEPDDSWDESVTALLNYPEVVKKMNDDLDWTWRLGEAVVNQQSDVIAAVESFRDRAYAAGNLKSDEHQNVTKNDDVIEIAPADEEVIYVPYYEPERVVVYQPRPVYYYYPRPYPLYDYPYPYGYNFYDGYFWGVTTAFSIGWATNDLCVFHHSYRGHPYYGRTYYPYWYRQPNISVYNTWYVNNRSSRTRDHYRNGDIWHPRDSGGARPGFHRSTAGFRDARRERSDQGYRNPNVSSSDVRAQLAARAADRSASRRPAARSDDRQPALARNRESAGDSAIRFREREGRAVAPPTDSRQRTTERGDTGERRATITTRRPISRSATPEDTSRSAAGDRGPRNLAPRSESRTPVRQPAPQTETRREVRSTVSRPADRETTMRVAPRPSTAPRVSQPAVSTSRSFSRPAESTPRVSMPQAAPRMAPSQPAPRASAPQPASRPSSASAPRASERPSSDSDHRRRRH